MKKTKNKDFEQENFPIVGIGASAGGLEAITLLLKKLPVKTGMAFVFIQHLDPNHESMLADILSRATKILVKTIKNNMKVEPDVFYVIPYHSDITISNKKFQLKKLSKVRGQHMPIDTFFKSLACEQCENIIGVVLSGTASDGVKGLQEIKGCGGITFAQSEETAKYTGMPRSAKIAGCVDVIASPQNIAKELVKISQHPYLRYPKVSDENDISIEKT